MSESQKLTASDPAAGDLFGISVAIDADTAVIGAGGKIERGDADAGAAYVFTLSGDTWVGQQILLPDISAADNFFGAAVVVSGDTALIGSSGDDIGANTNQGSAVVFVRRRDMVATRRSSPPRMALWRQLRSLRRDQRTRR